MLAEQNSVIWYRSGVFTIKLEQVQHIIQKINLKFTVITNESARTAIFLTSLN